MNRRARPASGCLRRMHRFLRERGYRRYQPIYGEMVLTIYVVGVGILSILYRYVV